MGGLLWNFASGVRNVAECDVVPSREHMREKKLMSEAAIKELGAVLQKRVIKNSPKREARHQKTMETFG